MSRQTPEPPVLTEISRRHNPRTGHAPTPQGCRTCFGRLVSTLAVAFSSADCIFSSSARRWFSCAGQAPTVRVTARGERRTVRCRGTGRKAAQRRRGYRRGLGGLLGRRQLIDRALGSHPAHRLGVAWRNQTGKKKGGWRGEIRGSQGMCFPRTVVGVGA